MNKLQMLLSRRWMAVLASLLGLAIVGLIFWNRASSVLDPQAQIGVRWIKPAGTEASYVGNEACKSCHPHEYQLYTAAPHSRTIHLIMSGEDRPEFRSRQTVSDELNGIFYTLRQLNGENQLVADTGSTRDVATARWIFGSGTRARAYLGQDNDEFLQLRLSYYPPTQSWSFTLGSGPGTTFQGASGDRFTTAQAAACFGCHSTVLVGTRSRLDLVHSRLDVGCESCHGPCRKHVESAQGIGTGTAMVTPPLHTGPEIMKLCGTCHREPGDISAQNISNETHLARFPGAALPRSRCFIESAGKLSCITCHNPHESTREQQEASFIRACLGCHTAPHGATCPRAKTSGCINCHMPVEHVTRKLPLFFHNHWIRKNPPGVA